MDFDWWVDCLQKQGSLNEKVKKKKRTWVQEYMGTWVHGYDGTKTFFLPFPDLILPNQKY